MDNDNRPCVVIPFIERLLEKRADDQGYDDAMARLQICQGDVGVLEAALDLFDQWDDRTDADDAVAKVVFDWLERRLGAYEATCLLLSRVLPGQRSPSPGAAA